MNSCHLTIIVYLFLMCACFPAGATPSKLMDTPVLRPGTGKYRSIVFISCNATVLITARLFFKITRLGAKVVCSFVRESREVLAEYMIGRFTT